MRVVVQAGDENPVEIWSMDVVPAVGDVLVWSPYQWRRDRGVVTGRTFAQQQAGAWVNQHWLENAEPPLEWVCTLTVEREP